MVRIGPHVIDTDWMTSEDMTTIITELRKIRARKCAQESLKEQMLNLLAEAKENHFSFINPHLMTVFTPEDIEVYDEES